MSRYIVQVDSDTYTRLDEQTLIGDEVVLHQDTDHEDMLETDEEVLDDDDCLDPPD